MKTPNGFEYLALLTLLVSILTTYGVAHARCDVNYNATIYAGGQTVSTYQSFGDGFHASMSCLSNVAHSLQTSDGTIYLSDQYFHTIRKVNTTTGIITLLAGQYSKGDTGDNVLATSAFLNAPTGMFINKNETYLYFASSSNCIRRIDLTTNIITTIVGKCGSTGFNDSSDPSSVLFHEPLSVALSDNETLMFIAETGNNRVRKFDFNTNVTTTLLGDGNSNFNPNSLLVYGNDLIISQGLNGAISRLDMTTLQGYTWDNFAYPSKMYRKEDLLYVAETNANQIVTFNMTSLVKTNLNLTGLTKGQSPMLDHYGNLIVANVIRFVYNYTTEGERRTFAGDCNTKFFAGLPLGQDSAPATSLRIKPIRISDAATYFVTNDYMIFSVNSTNGNATFIAGDGRKDTSALLMEGYIAYNSSIGSPGVSIAQATNGEIYFANSSLITKIDKNGKLVFVSQSISYGSGLVNIAYTSIADLLFNGSNLYVSDLVSITKINLLSNTVETVISNTSLVGMPGKLSIDPTDGNLVVFDRKFCTISKLLSNSQIQILAGSGTCGDWDATVSSVTKSSSMRLSDVKFLPNGDVIIAQFATCSIRKLAKSSNSITLLRTGTPCTGPQITLSTDSNGNIYYTEIDNSLIRKLTPSCENGYVVNESGTGCIPFQVTITLSSSIVYIGSSLQASFSVSNSELKSILKYRFISGFGYDNNVGKNFYNGHFSTDYPYTYTLGPGSTSNEGNYTISVTYLDSNKATYTVKTNYRVLKYETAVQESYLTSITTSDVATIASNSETYTKATDSASVISLVTEALATSDRNTSNLDETSLVTKALTVLSSQSAATSSVISTISSLVTEISTELSKLSSSTLQTSSSSVETTVTQVLSTFSNIISSTTNYNVNSTEVIDNMLIVASKASSVKDSLFTTNTSSFVVSVVRNVNASSFSNGNTSIVTPNELLSSGISVASVNYLNIDKLSSVFSSDSTKLTNNFQNVSSYLSSFDLVNIANPIDLKYISNGNFLQVSLLSNPIKLTFAVDNSTIASSSLTVSCKYFNETTNEWLSNGCTTQIDSTSSLVNCFCNHTTTFSAFVEAKLSTQIDKDIAIASIVLGSLLILFAIITLIGVISTHKQAPTKSRGVIPYFSLVSIIIELVFLFIVSNAILLSSNSEAASTVKYVSTMISCLFYCLAILNYTILNVRYVAFRYVYEIMAKLDENNVNFANEKTFKWIKFIFTSKTFIVILNAVFAIFFLAFYAIFLGLRLSIVITDAYTDVMAASIFAFVMTMSLIVCAVYLFDLYMEFNFTQLNTKLIAKDKKLLVNPIKNYFMLNDNLGFRKEFMFFLASIIFFVVSYSVGFAYFTTSTNATKAVEFAFDIFYNIMLIISFGGCVSVISIYELIRQKFNKKPVEIEDGDDFSDSQLKEILLNPSLCDVFKQFAKTEHSLENVIFWKKLYPILELVNKGEIPPSAELSKHFEEWRVTFVENNSPMEVNYSHKTKKSFFTICEAVAKDQRDDKEIKEILSDMYCSLTMNLDDTFSRFVLTDGFEKMNKLLELKEQMGSTLKLKE